LTNALFLINNSVTVSEVSRLGECEQRIDKWPPSTGRRPENSHQ